MYDGPDVSSDSLPLGERYAGQRKPSLIIEAMLPDLSWLRDKAFEWGEGTIEAHRPLYEALAWQALCKKEPDFDATIGSDDDEGWLGFSEAESLTIAAAIADLISILNYQTPVYTYYGWRSDDPDDDAYEKFGVWIDWDRLDAHLDDGKIATIPDPVLIDQEEAVSLIEDGAEYVLWDETGDMTGALELYRLSATHALELQWSA